MALISGFSAKRVAFALACTAMLATGACTKSRSFTGYVTDADLVNSISPGVDNRDSVMRTLGSPTFAAQFDQGDWYYFGRENRNFAFQKPDPTQQTVLRIQFDQAGTVTAITREGLENVANITPTSKKTPTLGSERGFFQDLFGNIGTVGAGAPPSQQQ